VFREVGVDILKVSPYNKQRSDLHRLRRESRYYLCNDWFITSVSFFLASTAPVSYKLLQGCLYFFHI